MCVSPSKPDQVADLSTKAHVAVGQVLRVLGGPRLLWKTRVFGVEARPKKKSHELISHPSRARNATVL